MSNFVKQMDECLTRAFIGKEPLKSKKWKGFIRKDKSSSALYLLLYHYHHHVLTYNIKNEEILHEWWERPADKRGLDSAKKWLSENKEFTKSILNQ